MTPDEIIDIVRESSLRGAAARASRPA